MNIFDKSCTNECKSCCSILNLHVGPGNWRSPYQEPHSRRYKWGQKSWGFSGPFPNKYVLSMSCFVSSYSGHCQAEKNSCFEKNVTFPELWRCLVHSTSNNFMCNKVKSDRGCTETPELRAKCLCKSKQHWQSPWPPSLSGPLTEQADDIGSTWGVDEDAGKSSHHNSCETWVGLIIFNACSRLTRGMCAGGGGGSLWWQRGWSVWLMQGADWVSLHLCFEWQLQGS